MALDVSSSVSFPTSSAVYLDAKSLVAFLHNHLDHPNSALLFRSMSIYIQGELLQPFVKYKVQILCNKLKSCKLQLEGEC